MKQQASGRIYRVDILVEDLECYLLTFQFSGDLAQMEGRAGQPIKRVTTRVSPSRMYSKQALRRGC